MKKRWLVIPCAALLLLAAQTGRSEAGSFFGPGPYGAPYLATHGPRNNLCCAWGWGGCGGNCNNGQCGQGVVPGVPYGCAQPGPPISPCNCGGFFGPPGAKFPYCPIWFPTWSDYAPKPMELAGPPPLPGLIPGVPVIPPAPKPGPPIKPKLEEVEE
jgi:hypothetical protein